MPLERRSKVTGLNPNRADIIVAGLAVVERIMRHLRVNVVQVHTRGVRDGLLLTMIQQGPATSIPAEERRAAVEEFARNAGVDLQHARQVARLAGSLWEQLAAPLSLKPEDRELIESAALVANVGYLINFEGHHKHSYHLILNSELPGFERRQLQLLASVARYHRGSPPKRKHADFIACHRTISGGFLPWQPSCVLLWRSTALISSTLQTSAPGLRPAAFKSRSIATMMPKLICGRPNERSSCFKKCSAARCALPPATWLPKRKSLAADHDNCAIAAHRMVASRARAARRSAEWQTPALSTSQNLSRGRHSSSGSWYSHTSRTETTRSCSLTEKMMPSGDS